MMALDVALVLDDTETASEPALKTPVSADFGSSKPLNQRRSFSSNVRRQKSSSKVKPKPADEIPIIAIDAEWVTEAALPDDDDDDDDDDEDDDPPGPEQIPHNLVLSYQCACRYNGREWSIIVYTRAGARTRYPDWSEAEIAKLPERVTFARLLATAIENGIKQKHMTRWPKKVVAAAHWTRADLSAMADFAAIKAKFDGVQKTYVTLGDPYLAHVNVAGHIRAFQVSLVDTLLLVPVQRRA